MNNRGPIFSKISRDCFHGIFLLAFFILTAPPLIGQENQKKQYFTWEAISSLPAVGNQPQALGVAGPIAGVHNNAIIIAGGANFNKPFWESDKQWHDDVWVLTSDKQWINAGKLDHPLAYSAVISTSLGVVAMGGADHEKIYDQVLLLKWDLIAKTVDQERLPPLLRTCAYGSAALIGDFIYLAGGSEKLELKTAMNNFWRLDLSNYGRGDFQWEELPAWPGPERAYNITVAQHNGYTDCIYVISGRREITNEWDVLDDVYEFNPQRYQSGEEDPWRRRANIPSPRMAGAGIAVGRVTYLF